MGEKKENNANQIISSGLETKLVEMIHSVTLVLAVHEAYQPLPYVERGK